MSLYRSGVFARGSLTGSDAGLRLFPPVPVDAALDAECARIYGAVGADLVRPPSAEALVEAILGARAIEASDGSPLSCDAELVPAFLGREAQIRIRAELTPSLRAYSLYYLLASREIAREGLSSVDYELSCDKLARALWLPRPALEGARAARLTIPAVARWRAASELDVVLRCADVDGHSVIVVDDREVIVRGSLASFCPNASDMRRLAQHPPKRLHRFFLAHEGAFVLSDAPNCHVL